MKFILLACLAVSASALNNNCNREFSEGLKCYQNKADGVVHEQGIELNLDDLQHCINEQSRKCGQSMSRELGTDYSNVDEETLERCAEDTMGDTQDDIQACMQKKFPTVDFQTKKQRKESPGLRLLAMIGSLKQGYKSCRQLAECIPQNYADIKKQLCDAKELCFDKDFDRQCPNIEKEVSEASCNCYKQLPNKNGLVREFNQCCGISGPRDLGSFVKTGIAQGGILKTVEKKLCTGKDDYSSRFGVCESDELEKAQKSQSGGGSSNNSGFNISNLFNRGGSSSSSGGNSGSGSSRGGWGNLFAGGRFG